MTQQDTPNSLHNQYLNEILTPKELAYERKTTVNALAQQRSRGTGPSYYQECRSGPVYYKRSDLIEFDNSIKRQSTSELY